MNSLKIAQDFLKLSYSFSSVQCDMPDIVDQAIYNWGMKNIPDNILTDDGRETETHVTVKYGIHITDFTEIRNLFVNENPIPMVMGDVSLFHSDEHDVIKIDVISPRLHHLNKLISSTFEVTDTHPEYKPHVTIAYVKPGYGSKYDGCTFFKGKRVLLNTVTFSGKDNKKTLFSLKSHR